MKNINTILQMAERFIVLASMGMVEDPREAAGIFGFPFPFPPVLEDVKKAYLAKAKALHPDKPENRTPEAQLAMKRLNSARETLVKYVEKMHSSDWLTDMYRDREEPDDSDEEDPSFQEYVPPASNKSPQYSTREKEIYNEIKPAVQQEVRILIGQPGRAEELKTNEELNNQIKEFKVLTSEVNYKDLYNEVKKSIRDQIIKIAIDQNEYNSIRQETLNMMTKYIVSTTIESVINDYISRARIYLNKQNKRPRL